MERAVFSWDGDNAPEFDGWHNPEERWNGFAVPYFELDTVREIASACNAMRADDPDAYDVVEIRDYTEPDKGVSVWVHTDDDAYEVETRTLADGQTVYSVGGWAWTWDDVRTLMPDLTDPDDVPPMDAYGKCVRCREWARDCLCQ